MRSEPYLGPANGSTFCRNGSAARELVVLLPPSPKSCPPTHRELPLTASSVRSPPLAVAWVSAWLAGSGMGGERHTFGGQSKPPGAARQWNTPSAAASRGTFLRAERFIFSRSRRPIWLGLRTLRARSAVVAAALPACSIEVGCPNHQPLSSGSAGRAISRPQIKTQNSAASNCCLA